MLREIEHGLVNARRQDSLPAAQDIVRAFQAEALALAYLFTGDRDRAAGLAEAAFLTLLRELRTLDPEADRRNRLMVHLARAFLRNEYTATPASQPEPVADALPKKYGVENQRERTLASLSRLDDGERAALLLSDLCGVDPGELNQRDNATLAAPIETVRQRLRQSLDLSSGDPLRPLLVEAGFDSPRDDLWPRLEGPYAEIQRREQRRRQLLTFGVAGTVILVALASIAAIFGPGLIDDNEANAAAEATPTVMDDDLVITSAPPVLPTPTPTPPLTPVGDVPGTLLGQTYHDGRSNNPYSTLSVYQPDNNQFQQVLADDERLAGSNSTPFHISPDGKQLVVVRQEQTALTWRFTAIALDTTTLERQWETQIGVFERGSEQYGPSVRMSTAITSERVYVAVTSHEESGSISVRGYSREDGSLRERTSIALDLVNMDLYFRGNVFLFARGDSELVLAIQAYDIVAAGTQSLFIYPLELPTLASDRGPVEFDDLAAQSVGLWGASMTPDGDALYALAYTSRDGGSQVSFLDLDTGEMTELPLPFTKQGVEPYVPTSSVLSHDGRRLYVLDQTGGHIAIVDLVQQRVERFFPLDTGEFDALFGSGSDQFVLGWTNAISPDGTRLFIAADVGDRNRRTGPIEESGVWVIDLTRWRIVDFWPVEGQASQIYPVPQEQAVLVSSWFYTSQQSTQTVSRFDMADGSALQTPVDVPATEDGNSAYLVSLADLYRGQHGRSPSIDGVEQTSPTDFQTLPIIEASATSDNTASGVATEVEVRILDPASGETLTSSNADVRFDPDSSVTAILQDEDESRQIVVLARIEEGVYRGSVTFETVGRWTIDVDVASPDGTISVSPDAGWVDVAPTFNGSDNRIYQFAISSHPEQPLVDEDITINLKLIDVESGVPLPDGVTLVPDQAALEGDPIEAMPERIDVALIFARGNQPGVYRTALLYAVSAGVYKGTTQLVQPGTWVSEIRFQPPNGRRFNIPAGTIEVGE